MCEKCRELGIDHEEAEEKATYGFTMMLMQYVQFKYYKRVEEIEGQRPEVDDWDEQKKIADTFDKKLDEGLPAIRELVKSTAQDLADLWHYIQTDEPDPNWIREPELRELVDTGEMSPLEYVAGVIGALIARWAMAEERIEQLNAELFVYQLSQMGEL
jgi:hypothetical protein